MLPAKALDETAKSSKSNEIGIVQCAVPEGWHLDPPRDVRHPMLNHTARNCHFHHLPYGNVVGAGNGVNNLNPPQLSHLQGQSSTNSVMSNATNATTLSNVSSTSSRGRI